MKTIIKRTIILSTIILSTLSLSAQIKYGVQAHGLLNKSSFEIGEEESPEKDWKLGYGIGFFAEIPLTNNFNLRPSLNYLEKGVKMNQDFSIEGVTTTQKANMKLNYIEMPVLVIYNIGKSSSKWYVGAGPSFGYGISGKADVSQTTDGYSENLESKIFKDVEDDGLGFKRFDFSLNAMVGMRAFEKGMIQLGYLHSLSNIANTDGFNDNKFKNRSITLSLAYCFN